MKTKMVLVNGAWVLVAGACFAVGRMQVGSGGTGDSVRAGATGGTVASISEMVAGATSGGGETDGTGVRLKGGEPTMVERMLRMGSLSGDGMKEVIAEALKESDPLQAQLLFTQILQAMTPENAASAMEALREAPRGRTRDQQMGMFHYAWGQLDGAAAAEYTAKMDGREKDWASRGVMSGWASKDPAAALAWLEGMEGEDDRGEAREGLVSGMARADVGMATEYALKREAAEDRDADDYMREIARQVLREGAVVASKWIDGLPDGEAKGDAMKEVTDRFVEEDLDAAALWVKQYADSEHARDAVGEIADELAERDAGEALDWISSLPEGGSRSRAFAAAFWEWTENDPVAASEHLSTMKEGADKDQAVAAFARRHAGEDAESAVAWAGTITDEKIRQDVMRDAGQQLIRRDPAAAAAWLETSGLPAETQERMLRDAERGDRRRWGR